MKNKLWILILILELGAVCCLVISMMTEFRDGESNRYLPVALGLNCVALLFIFLDRKKKESANQKKVNYEHKPEMTFIGFSTTIRPDEGYTKCPEFWNKEYSEKYARLWQTMQPETPVEKAILENQIGMFAICDDKDGSFDYWIAGLYRGGEVPEGLKLYTFPESDWAVFSAKGALPDSLQNLNTYVWNDWYTNEGKQHMGSDTSMLEVYSAGDMQSPDYECGIWVPVMERRV